MEPKIPDLHILGLELEDIIVIIEISTLELVCLQNLAEKQKCLKFGTKIPYLGIFGLEFEISTLEFI